MTDRYNIFIKDNGEFDSFMNSVKKINDGENNKAFISINAPSEDLPYRLIDQLLLINCEKIDSVYVNNENVYIHPLFGSTGYVRAGTEPLIYARDNVLCGCSSIRWCFTKLEFKLIEIGLDYNDKLKPLWPRQRIYKELLLNHGDKDKVSAMLKECKMISIYIDDNGNFESIRNKIPNFIGGDIHINSNGPDLPQELLDELLLIDVDKIKHLFVASNGYEGRRMNLSGYGTILKLHWGIDKGSIEIVNKMGNEFKEFKIVGSSQQDIYKLLLLNKGDTYKIFGLK